MTLPLESVGLNHEQGLFRGSLDDTGGLRARRANRSIRARRLRLLSLVSVVLVVVATVAETVAFRSSIFVSLGASSSIILVAVAIVAFHSRASIHLNVVRALSALAILTALGALLFEGPIPVAPVVTISTLLLTAATLFLTLDRGDLRTFADWLAAFAILIAGTTLLAFLFRVEEIEGIQRFTAISLPSAAGLVLLGTGVLFADTDRGVAEVLSDSNAAGRMVRWFLPTALGSTLVLGLLMVAASRAAWFSTEFAIPLFVELQMIILSFLIWRSAHDLQQIDDERARAEQDLRLAKDELEERVERRTAELRAANSELESFSYSISHDLRAPLRAIDGFSRILEEDHADELGDEGKRQIEIIRSNTHTMAQLITDLLSFSRISRLEVNAAPVDLARLAGETLGAITRDREVEQNFQVDEVPPAHADSAMIRQVLENLFSNAVKYSEPKPGGTIRFSAEPGARFVRYVVSDQGVGFDANYSGKLFGVFQRLHHAEEFEGTGVGLSIVKRIIEKHGGEVGAESILGEGATFWFTLPVIGKANEKEESGRETEGEVHGW